MTDDIDLNALLGTTSTASPHRAHPAVPPPTDPEADTASIDDLLTSDAPEDPHPPGDPEPPIVFRADVPAHDQPGTELAEAIAEGRRLVAALSRSKWELGDLILRVCGPPSGPGPNPPTGGFTLRRFAAEIDLSEAQASQYRLVADAFPPGQRNASASWSVHRFLVEANLPDEERHEIVQRQRWTVPSLAAYLDSLNDEPEDDPEPAPSAAPSARAAAPASAPAPDAALSAPSAPIPAPEVPPASGGDTGPEIAADTPATEAPAPALVALRDALESARELELPDPLAAEIDALLAHLAMLHPGV